MTLLAIIVIIAVIIGLFGNRISDWIRGFMARRFEDHVRKMMGMPSRKEEEKARKAAKNSSGSRTYTTHPPKGYDGPIIPGEYAEDVDFVEIKEYSSSTIVEEDAKGDTKVYHESQVEDAEYVEIKESKK